MYRKVFLVVFLLLFVSGFTGCTDEKQIQSDATILAQSDTIQALTSDTASLHAAVQNAIYAAAEQKRLFDSTNALLVVANGKITELRSERKQLQSQLAVEQAEVTRLTPFEAKYAECSKELTVTKADLTNIQSENVNLQIRVTADSTLLDSVHQCYDVQKHNAGRSWWNKTFGGNFWGLPFPEPAVLTTPVITANPVVKPEPAEKKSRRRR